MNVYFPAGQLCGKPYILTLVAYCKRQLRFRHAYLADLRLVALDLHRNHLCGRKRLGYKLVRIVAVFYYIYLLARKLLDYLVNARASRAYTGAYRVNFRVVQQLVIVCYRSAYAVLLYRLFSPFGFSGALPFISGA